MFITPSARLGLPITAPAPVFAGKREDTRAMVRMDHGKAFRAEVARAIREHLWPTRPRVVEKVVDGDTFTVRGGTRVRLFGVDAPETNTEAGERARAYLAGLLEGGTVRLHIVNTDRFGRYVAIVERQWVPFLPVFYENLNERVVRDGWAFASEQNTVLTDSQERYIRTYYKPLEDAARQNRRGMWQLSSRPRRPWNDRHSV